MLGLGKEHYLAAAAHRCHGGLDERIDAHGQNHRIRAAALGCRECALGYVSVPA